jgi:hypothetical protein
LQVGEYLPQPLDDLTARLQRAVIQARLQDYGSKLRAFGCVLAGNQIAPGHNLALTGDLRSDDFIGCPENAAEGCDFGRAGCLGALFEDQAQGSEQTRKGGIVPELADERLGIVQPFDEAFQLLLG